VKLSRRSHNYRGVPRDVTRDDVTRRDRDVTRDDVITDDEVGAPAEWRLSGLWVNESDVCHVDPFIVRRPPPPPPAAAATATDNDDNNDDDDDDNCVERPRRRSRPDLVPRQSSSVTSPHDQELNKTRDDVTVLYRLPSPVHCHCMPASQADFIT